MREALLRKRYLLPGETEKDMYRRVAKYVWRENESILTELMSGGKFLPNTPTLANAGTNRVGGLSACYVLPIEDSLEGIYSAVRAQAMVHKHFGGTGFDLSPLRPKGSAITSTGGGACGPVKVLQLLNQSAETVSQGGKREGANMGILRMDHPDVREFIHCKSKEGLQHFNISVAITDDHMCGDLGILDDIAQCATTSGDPGIIFISAIERANPTPLLGSITATNPCGEQPLLPYESCNLGSINLSKYVSNGEFDYDGFKADIWIATMFLDRVIDVNVFPLESIRAATRETRKIGLGIMGWADMLVKMGVSYQDMDKVRSLITTLGSILRDESRAASRYIAEEYGTFPAWEDSTWGDLDMPIRNATLTTIAPTGSISFLAGCSSGIEPIFDWYHTRTSEEGSTGIQSDVYELAKKNDLLDDTAHNIPARIHVLHQALWQEYIDNAVSKTINLPRNTDWQYVREIMMFAWENGCKGITVYVDGSKDKQVLTTDYAVPKLPDGIRRRVAHVYEAQSGCGVIRVIPAAEDDTWGKLHEVYVLTAGGCAANNETTGRLISDELQNGIPVNVISSTLHKVKCVNAMKNRNSVGKSCSDIIATCIDIEQREFIEHTYQHAYTKPTCPQCGEILTFEGGCGTGSCTKCGWSGCS